MIGEMVLVVRLRVESARKLLRDHLIELFGRSKDEDTFVSANVLEDIGDPEQLLVYRMSKPDRSNYEKLVLDLRVERTAQLLKPTGSWVRGAGGQTASATQEQRRKIKTITSEHHRGEGSSVPALKPCQTQHTGKTSCVDSCIVV